MLKLREDRHAIQQRHGQIEDHQVRLVLFDCGQRVHTIGRLDHLSEVFQTALFHGANIGLIIHDQKFRLRHHCLHVCSPCRAKAVPATGSAF